MATTIEFKNVKEVHIPEGDVFQIQKTDGTIIWKKSSITYIRYFDSEEGYGGETGSGSYILPFYPGEYNIVVIGGGGGSGKDTKSYASNWWSVGYTGGSAPFLFGKITISEPSILNVVAGTVKQDSSCKNGNETINIIGPQGNTGSSGAWYSTKGTGGAKWEVNSDWSNITHTGVTPLSKNDGPAGEGSGVIGLFSEWNQDSSDYANSSYPYGCSPAVDNGTNGNNQGYVKIWLVNKTLAYSSEDTKKGTVSGTAAGSYQWGTEVTVRASAANTYNFSGWYSGSTKVSSDASYTFALKSDVNLVAKFTLITKSLAYSSEDTNKGTVSGTTAGRHAYGTSVSITASPATGYNFSGWYSGSTCVSTSATYTFSLTSDVNLVAKFTAKSKAWKILDSFGDTDWNWVSQYYKRYQGTDLGHQSSVPPTSTNYDVGYYKCWKSGWKWADYAGGFWLELYYSN